MELYEVSPCYVEYLKQFEPSKILSVADGKERRKFLGIIVQNDEYKYVVPLSSPKYQKDFSILDYDGKHLPEDFSFLAYKRKIVLLKKTSVPVVYMYHIDKEGIDFFGKIQCNNMIPVVDSVITKVDVDGVSDIAYKSLLQKQIQFIRKNEDVIMKKHINVVYVNRKRERMDIGYIKYATPDFTLLEEKCTAWENKEVCDVQKLPAQAHRTKKK